MDKLGKDFREGGLWWSRRPREGFQREPGPQRALERQKYLGWERCRKLECRESPGPAWEKRAEPASLFICIVTFLPVISSALFLRILTPDSFKPACLILLKGPIPKHLSLSRPLRFSLDQQAQPALHFRGPFE